MDEYASKLEQFLDLGSIEQIAREMSRRNIDWSKSTGHAAQLACTIIVLRKIESVINGMDRSTTQLQQASIRLSRWAVVLAIFALAGTIIQSVVAVVG